MVTVSSTTDGIGGRPGLEIWAGLECSNTRVGDRYSDQLTRTGHRSREGDLDRIATLGVRVLRYPVLWEDHAFEPSDWTWADRRMSELCAREIEPIVGLVHHGSGPPYTSLLDPGFSRGLAAHAAAVATRYPWVRFFNPVNEPLTTARFSALYGLWYPHARDDRSFVRALLVQCDAIRRAMRAIRRVNPEASLVQTEDMGYTYSTPALADQAAFDNGRRWLSFDLLEGRVGREHPFWRYFRENGASEAELMSFVERPCAPDLLGINYYVTSERFLDERLDRYPAHVHGGNGTTAYADVPAVRASVAGILGAYGILRQVWERYRRPLAITEAHMDCTREEQLRWLLEAWQGARRLSNEGADVRAVTVWSLFGAFDWDHLLTIQNGYYEPGAFDLRSPAPRPTAIAKAVSVLCARGEYHHPVVETAGWWHRPDRLLYPPAEPAPRDAMEIAQANGRSFRTRPQPIAVTGATGTLGRAFERICRSRGVACRILSRREMDIASPPSVEAALNEIEPWAVVNTAGYVRVDEAESDRERCFRENTAGAACLAEACAARGIPLLTFSSDLVFDGAKSTPYVESDAPAPINVYGESKREAERKVLELWPSALVVRTSAFFGPWDGYNFVSQALRRLAADEGVQAPEEIVVSPTYVPDLVHACLDLLVDGESGLWHLANGGAVSWFDFARRAAALGGFREGLIRAGPLRPPLRSAPLPVFSALGSERGQLLPALEDALERYFETGAATHFR